MAMVKTISEYWLRIQSSPFPWIEEPLGELTEKGGGSYARDLTTVRGAINFAEYSTDYGDIAAEVCYDRELSRQSRVGLEEFCKWLIW